METLTNQEIELVSKPVSKVDEIVMSLANPRQAPKLVRFSDIGTGAPTLLFKGQSDFTYDYTAASVETKQLPSKETMFILRRDAAVPLIYYNANIAAASWQYDWFSVEYYTTLFPIGGGLNYVEPAWGDATLPYQPHGAWIPAFKSKRSAHRYMWVDGNPGSSGSLIGIIPTDNTGAAIPVPAGFHLTVKIFKWDGQQDNFIGNVYIPSGGVVGSYTIGTYGGYFRIEVFYDEFAAPTPGTSVQGVLVRSSGTCANFCHIKMNNIDNISKAITAERVLTTTLKVTNASAPGFAAGMIYEGDVYNGQQWTTLAKGSVQVGGLDTLQTRPAGNGFYGFTRVENLDDFDMRTQITLSGLVNDGTSNDDVYGDLDQDSPYKVIVFILPPPGNFPTDRFLNIELTTVLEAMGNTDLTEPEYPDTSPEQWEAALTIYSSLPSGYENPTHWRDILAAIGKVGATVTPVIAEQLRGITTGHPLLVAAAQFGGNVSLPIFTKGFEALQKLKRKKK